ncbi:MAG: B12-binding domain-containing radical SAM protein [Elusimicrobia bacterium]|nr:B12-binding domain-containing radical SAM protein [Elusimicrobiota bacterium]MBU2614751.1 B12-binding domain-containing radical SAM protein [Elusimicrobiota bacterium]
MENSKKNVLVVYSTADPRREIKNVNAILPASVLYVATPASKEYNVKILDTRLDLNWRNTITGLAKEGIYAAGLSCMTGYQIQSASEVARHIRSINPSLPIIWGGVHPSLVPQQTLKNGLVDFVVIGLGEETFLELLNNLDKPDNYPDIKGIGFKRNGTIIVNPEREFFDLNKYPIPNYSLINVNDYLIDGNIPIFTSRGCPHRCSFCYNLAFNHKKYAAIKTEHVINHIEYLLKNYPGITAISFVDDNFFVNKKRVTEICNKLIEKGIFLKLNSGCRADYLDNFSLDFLKLLRKTGFTETYVGVESGSEKILDDIHKDISVEQVLRINKKLKEAGIIPRFGFMGGFPGETIEDVKKTLRLMVNILEDNPNAYVTQLMLATLSPGTELFESAKKFGFVPPPVLEQYFVFNYEAWDESPYPWIKDEYKKFVKEMAYMVTWIDAKGFSGKNPLHKLINRILGRIVRKLIKNNNYPLLILLSRFIKTVGGNKLIKGFLKKILKFHIS